MDGHHICHWASRRETSLANLALFCRVHHRAVEEGRYTNEATGDPRHPLRFRRPDGTVLTDPVQSSGHQPRSGSSENRQLGLASIIRRPYRVGPVNDSILVRCVEALLDLDSQRTTE